MMVGGEDLGMETWLQCLFLPGCWGRDGSAFYCTDTEMSQSGWLLPDQSDDNNRSSEEPWGIVWEARATVKDYLEHEKT